MTTQTHKSSIKYANCESYGVRRFKDQEILGDFLKIPRMNVLSLDKFVNSYRFVFLVLEMYFFLNDHGIQFLVDVP